jgi:hypothetical protein
VGVAALVCLLAGSLTTTAGPLGSQLPADVVLADLREQVRDPFFAFVISMTAHDSLGAWTAADLLAFADAWPEPSVFPLAEHLHSLTREVVPVGQRPRLRGAVCNRRWVLHLQADRVEVPMPMRILGYRPGKLSFQGPLVLAEWRLGERFLHLSHEGQDHEFLFQDLTIYQLTDGWLIMDVHAWLDRLLGKSLDDAAMEGFMVSRVDGQLVGVGNSAGRNGRRIFGELDFRSGEVQPHGRPLVLALSRYGRHWTRPPDFDARAIWAAYRD